MKVPVIKFPKQPKQKPMRPYDFVFYADGTKRRYRLKSEKGER